MRGYKPIKLSEEKLYQLLRAYFDNTIALEDCTHLLKYIDEADEEVISLAIDLVLSEFKTGVVYTEEQSYKVFDRIISDKRFIRSGDAQQSPIMKIYWNKWLKYAAVFILFLSLGLYLFNNKLVKHESLSVSKKTVKHIADSAKVTLSINGGEVLVLDSLSNGVIAIAGSTAINKTGDKQLSYQSSTHKNGAVANYHTLSVPRGATYQVLLPDGTMVWLNAASSLRFPASFTGNKRKVSLIGEAYFEVAKQNNKPFLIEANGQTIEVLGTHFNVSAYRDDEFVKTTLLEGSVKVASKNKFAVLAPGQQSIIKTNQPVINIRQANIEEVMAWKNGYFVFDDVDIKSIMKDLVRWYNVEVEYEGEITNQKIGGTFSKAKNLKELLDYLEALGDVHFKTDGRRVIVMP